MEVILNNLYNREFFENGGIIKTKKDEVIDDSRTFIKLKITSDDIETANIGNKNYIYDDKADNHIGGKLDDNNFVPAQYIDCAVISPLTFEIWPNILTLVDVSHGGYFDQDTYPTITNI